MGIAFKWRDTSLAFVMCHLPARPDVIRLRKREADYKALVKRMKLETTALQVRARHRLPHSLHSGRITVLLAVRWVCLSTVIATAFHFNRAVCFNVLQATAGMDFVHAHDHVFFFGDHNYRVELPFERFVAKHLNLWH